ncbi:MAG TPA: hypothetical protein VN030_00845 [Cellvibrio sp.]|nr:hypothetical protein [Cellvibrio sp.]
MSHPSTQSIKQLLLGLVLLLGTGHSALSHAETGRYLVQVRAVSPERAGNYYTLLLQMILEASKKPGETIEIQLSDRQFTQARWIAEVQTGQFNEVLWTTTSKERERLLHPIRVPIFKGLLGKRFLVIRRKDEALFAKVHSKADLTELIAGQGAHWSDTDILEANGLPVTVGGGKETLYRMLKADRFDYFPRGVSEIYSEYEFMAENDLVVEKHLMLSYVMPIYYFVNKNNTELALRLEKGWNIILQNGQFNTFFFAHPRIKTAIEEYKKHKRTIIVLDNPYLPDYLPFDHPEYWMDLSAY